MVAVVAIDGRVYFWKDEGRCSGNGVGRSAGSEKGFPFLKDGGERHLLGGLEGRLSVIVEVGRMRHVSTDQAAPGIAAFRSEESGMMAALREPSSFYTLGRS